MTTLLLAWVLLGGESGEPPHPDPVRRGESAEVKPSPPGESGLEESNAKEERQAKDEPPGEGEKKLSDLDRELLGELGQPVEAEPDEEADPLLRAGRRMREVEGKLAQREADDPTIELQEKIIRDLDELLQQQQNGNPPPNNKNKKQKQKQGQQRMAQNQQQQRAQQQRGNQQANESANRAGPPRMGREEFGAPKEVKDVWGHLSDLLRAEMSQYAKEGFLDKYRDLLEQYYSTIASESGAPRRVERE